MLKEVIHPPQDLLSLDDVSSPLSAQILEFCHHYFLENLQSSEVASTSNCCYDENSPCTTNLSGPSSDIEKLHNCQDYNYSSTTTTAAAGNTNTTAAANANNNNLSMIFDSQDKLDNEISASIDFSSSPSFSIPQFITTTYQNHQLDFTSPTDMVSSDMFTAQYPSSHSIGLPLTAEPPPLLPSVFEDDCLPSIPSYVTSNPSSSSPPPSCSFMGPSSAISSYLSGSGTMASALSADSSGIFSNGGILVGSELQPLEMEFQGENCGIYYPDAIIRVFNPGNLQTINKETQQFTGVGVGNSTSSTSEISSVEESAFKVSKLSVEQRKEKIHRYLKKRNERNFSKKIKYACRKTLADSRPRVRGRFAKNDDFGENKRPNYTNHEDEDEDEDEIAVKEGEECMVNASGIFGHAIGVNSFNCNSSIHSFI